MPRNPLRAVQRATQPLFAELREVLEGIAAALAAGDRAAAERLLVRARATSDQSGRLRQAVEQARETVRLAPTYWRSRDDVARYAEAAPHVDLAVRNVRVLARAALSVVETSATVPPGVPARAARARERRASGSSSELDARPRRRRGDRGGRSPPPAARRSRSTGTRASR